MKILNQTHMLYKDKLYIFIKNYKKIVYENLLYIKWFFIKIEV